MTVHERSAEVRTSPTRLFHLLGAPGRIPDFCPAVAAAESLGNGVVRLSPAMPGNDVDILVERDPSAMHVSWALLRDPSVHGVIIIQPGPDFAGENGCIVKSVVEDGAPDIFAAARAHDPWVTHDPRLFGGPGRPLPGGPAHAEGLATALRLPELGPGEVMGRMLDDFRRYCETGVASRGG